MDASNHWLLRKGLDETDETISDNAWMLHTLTFFITLWKLILIPHAPCLKNKIKMGFKCVRG